MKTHAAILVNLTLALLAVPPADAQGGTGLLYEFAVEAEFGPHEVPINGLVEVPVTFKDLSRDTPTAFLPDGSPELPLFLHQVSWELSSRHGNDQGWVAQPMTGFFSTAGEERTVILSVLVGPTATNPYFQVNVTAVIETEDGTRHRSVDVLFYTPGISGFAVRNARSLEIEPHGIAPAGLIITNAGVFPRTFEAEITQNPCNLRVTEPSTTVVPPRQSVEVGFSVQGPEDRLLYLSEDCSVMMRVFAIDNPDRSLTAVVSVVVNGSYVDPSWAFTALALIAALVVMALFVATRKGRIEEELLGKPQKPWTIPVEKVYLDRLEETDPQAHYVVRHYLMEEEYRSALMWYHAYKRGTKNQRAKERLIVAQEKSYNRWRKRELAVADKPLQKADKFEAKLQRKLDRKGAKRHKAEHAKWQALVNKLEEAHAKKLGRLEAKWESAAKKARKRGETEPERPVLAGPELPEEPMLVGVPLEEHRWSKKADRFRGRMDRRNERLLAKFEKADARHLAKVRRKARKAAKKLDDPDFVEEHPLLLGESA